MDIRTRFDAICNITEEIRQYFGLKDNIELKFLLNHGWKIKNYDKIWKSEKVGHYSKLYYWKEENESQGKYEYIESKDMGYDPELIIEKEEYTLVKFEKREGVFYYVLDNRKKV